MAGGGAQQRRARVDQMRREQQRTERRRTLLVVGATVAIGVVIIGFAVLQVLNQDKASPTGLASIGVSHTAAACQPMETAEPTGTDRSGVNGNHVNPGTHITYQHSPPAYGRHWSNPLQPSEVRAFWTAQDRPPVERLVHSLEHGWTILWYDESVAGDSSQLSDVKAIAATFTDFTDTSQKFMAAPWTADDGAPFPQGTHLALTHWSRGGVDATGDQQLGVWEYCGKVSGEVVADFMKKYPALDSPEGPAGVF
jgi:hypothetical protein